MEKDSTHMREQESEVVMNSQLESNIMSIYGEEGRIFELHQGLASSSSKLVLRELKEVTHLGYYCVFSGVQKNYPIILKLGSDTQDIS